MGRGRGRGKVSGRWRGGDRKGGRERGKDNEIKISGEREGVKDRVRGRKREI